MTARDKWTPEIGRVYGLMPWEMELLTVGELVEIEHDLAALAAEAAELRELAVR